MPIIQSKRSRAFSTLFRGAAFTRAFVAGAIFCATALVSLASPAHAQSCSPLAGLAGDLPPCLRPVSPVLNCVQPNLDGTFTAQWGYISENSTCCPAYELPIRSSGVGEDVRANFFSPAPIDRGQPTFFTPGSFSNAFSTTWDGSPLTWTLRYFTLTPPFFADASVTAMANGNSPFCSTDCLGNPNGNAVVDRCGVCDGDGTSCLGCTDTNITATQLALDSGAQQQEGLINEALYLYRRVRGDSASVRRYVRKTRAESQRLADENWVSTWTLPPVIVSCTNNDFCVTVNSSPLLDPYVRNSDLLRDIAFDVTSRIRKNSTNSRQRSRARTLETRANELHELNLVSVNQIPATISSCN